MAYVTAEVEVDLGEFNDEEIRDEYVNRGLGPDTEDDIEDLCTYLWTHKRPEDFPPEIVQLVQNISGRIWV